MTCELPTSGFLRKLTAYYCSAVMPRDRVFLTGGSGVVGGAVLRRLLTDGRAVRALARSDDSAAALGALGAEPVRGDVLDIASITAAMAGCDVAYHLAGVNLFCLRNPSAMRAVNIAGSSNCVLAAARAGVARVVYTSSAATLGEAFGTVGREDSPHRGSFLSEYERSKYDAERAVVDVAERHGVGLVCVNPSSVQGPGRATGTGQVLVQYLRGRLPFWVETTVSLVDIDDCATGHILAEQKGATGERYVLNAASLSSPALLALMREIAPGVTPPRVVPKAVAGAVVLGVEAVARARGRTPRICRESLRALAHGHRYDGSKAERELGLRYRPAEDTIRRTAAWLVERGMVPADSLRPRK
jgi:dihydroflavonol-4-reductase